MGVTDYIGGRVRTTSSLLSLVFASHGSDQSLVLLPQSGVVGLQLVQGLEKKYFYLNILLFLLLLAPGP